MPTSSRRSRLWIRRLLSKDKVFSKQESILGDNSSICSSPVILHENCECNTKLPFKSCYTLQAAAILYNTALTYHLSLMRPPKIAGAYSNAIALYKMVYTLGVQEKEVTGFSQIIIPTLNNLGQIHHELGEFNKSMRFMEDLMKYISTLGEFLSRQEATVERQDFMLNYLILRAAHGAAAA
eukprot:CAMPEP_0116822856 /NCGR_PEP_ID=MMETSP0418-20121206/506_1 /TAXON_ID=1158023 /ORGANISM="Astrosyne radiata, Strain 13vi08-1A" /LENGTH=180 /DNA_ID=CAMNT_0004451027 /DNA_START=106 /DNA_END=648 /DNA_ORIENTATION=-